MPRHDPRALLADVVEACERILEATAGKTLDDYTADWRLRAIVERQFITIGEAISSLVRLGDGWANRITGSRRIIDFRNILVHGYDLIDDPTVWDVVETDVQRLRDEARSLLAELGEDPSS